MVCINVAPGLAASAVIVVEYIAVTATAIVVCCSSGCSDGVVVFLWGFWFICLSAGAILLVKMWRLPPEVRAAANAVKAAFRTLYPEDTFGGVGVQALKPRLFVICVWYHPPGVWIDPPLCRYFAVLRRDMETVRELYRPQWDCVRHRQIWPRKSSGAEHVDRSRSAASG